MRLVAALHAWIARLRHPLTGSLMPPLHILRPTTRRVPFYQFNSCFEIESTISIIIVPKYSMGGIVWTNLLDPPLYCAALIGIKTSHGRPVRKGRGGLRQLSKAQCRCETESKTRRRDARENRNRNGGGVGGTGVGVCLTWPWMPWSQ